MTFTQIISGNSFSKTIIIPEPQKISYKTGIFELSTNNISIGYTDDALEFSAELIANSLLEYHNIEPEIKEGNGNIFLQIADVLPFETELDSAIVLQAYQLTIDPSGISITGLSPKAVFYGAMSLIQLIENTPSNQLQSLDIQDWPDLNIRGVSDDISRGQVSTINNFYRVLDFIARYKMNTYMPYIEDMLEFDSYPSIGKNRGALTKGEVRDIVQYAEERFIDVIPIFQTLGHFENILTQDEFLEYAEFPGAASLNISDEGIYLFLENLLDEVFELFPSEYIHIGADESYDAGKGKSKDLVSNSSLSEVLGNHYKRVYEICKKNNKKVMMYGDILIDNQNILEMIPKDIVIVDWDYNAETNYRSTNVFKEAGFNYLVSPSVWNFKTTFPNYQTGLPNISSYIKNGIDKGSAGMINSNWGDYGAETFKEFSLFGYAWSAQCSWSYDKSKISDFNNKFWADFFGIRDDRLNELYKIFSNQFNQLNWNEVWRHPALNLRSSAWWQSRTNREETINWMEWTLPHAYEIMDEFEPIISRNPDHFELLRYLIYLDYWYINKLKTSHFLQQRLSLMELRGKLKSKKVDKEKIKREIVWIEEELESIDLAGMINQNIVELNTLKDQYEQIWLNYYKPENLGLILDKFNRLISYFKESEQQINNDTINSPEIVSSWIYCAKNRRRSYDKANFKKEFTLKGDVESALLQLIGQGHVKLYVNGEFVGEVFARSSGSLIVELKKYLFVDISNYLKSGRNNIEVRAESYRGNSGAGINVISEIKTDEETRLILSDKTWRSRPADKSNAKWKKPIIKKYRYPVIAPNFQTKRTSWIEK